MVTGRGEAEREIGVVMIDREGKDEERVMMLTDQRGRRMEGGA